MIRSPLASLAALSALALSAEAQSFRAVEVTDGLTWPVWIGAPPGDSYRMFVVELNKGVRIIDHGVLRSDRFLDISARLNPTGEGLNGMAFHPDYASNGLFYTIYNDSNDDSYLSQWSTSGDPNFADPGSEVILLGPVAQPDPNIHNWNALAFGPDGMLYAALGDGGPANDPNNHGQRLDVLLGKVLRLDVDAPAPHIPADNPFVGVPGVREEIWAYGLREPWRFSFDRLTGDLWIADVGQGHWEEVDFQPHTSGGGENYGWACLEGTSCTANGGCSCVDPTLSAPVWEYAHGPPCAIIGGFVYRGAQMPWLKGRYFFADFCNTRLESFAWNGASASDHQDHTVEIQPCSGALGPVVSIGEDDRGELYLLTSGNGSVMKLVPADDTLVRYCEGAPNSVGNGAILSHLGTTSVAANDFALKVRNAPPGQFALFYYGTNQNMLPFGDGFRCVSGTTWRLGPPLTLDGNGAATRAIDNQDPPSPQGQIADGRTFQFQCWYRDPAGAGAGFNLSDALRVEFCP